MTFEVRQVSAVYSRPNMSLVCL